MKSRTILSRFDEARALVVDMVSFGFVNLLQARHPLPADFRTRWEEFRSEWDERPVADFYQIPEAFVPPELPDEGRLFFPSPYPGEHVPNNQAAFDFFPCKQGWTAPTMLLAHGLMSVSDFGYRLWARRLNERGWNAVFVHLPYHYSRRLPWQFHGELSVGGDLLRTAAGIRQSVVECRIVLQQLRKKGGQLFGGWGTSYGGWILALVSCFEPLLQRLVLVEPILNLENATWKAPSSVTMRRALRRAGIGPEDTAHSMRLVCPGRHKSLLRAEHILMLAGQYDQIAPPEEIEELARAWGGAHFACFPQGHVGYTLMPESFRMAQEIWAADFTTGPSFGAADAEVKREAMEGVWSYFANIVNQIIRTQSSVRMLLGMISIAVIIVGEFIPERRGDIYGEAAIGYFLCVARLCSNPYGGSFLGLLLVPVAFAFVIFMFGSLLLTLLSIVYISVCRSPAALALKILSFVFFGLALLTSVGLSLTLLSHYLGWGGPDPVSVEPYYYSWSLFFGLLGFSYYKLAGTGAPR